MTSGAALTGGLAELLEAGGWVAAPLLAVSMALWFIATLRWLSLRRGFAGEVADRVRSACRGGLDSREPTGPVDRYLAGALAALGNPSACQHDLERILEVERERVRDFGLVLQAFVTVAPLLGLLGTVSGMVELFASMQGGAVSRATEHTVVSGISTALVSTQLGLVIGVPGLVAARMLSRTERRRARELGRAHSVLVELKQVQP